MSRRWMGTFVLLVLPFWGAACSGGGGGDGEGDPPDAPALRMSLQGETTLHFTWDDVEDESVYRLYEDPDGASGFSRIAGVGVDVTSCDIDIVLAERSNAWYALEACNAHGCSRSNAVSVADLLGSGMTYIKAPVPDRYATFGLCVALSDAGTTLVVGARNEDGGARGIRQPGDADYLSSQQDDSAPSSGAVYVYVREGGAWVEQAYIKAPNADPNDGFGTSLALSHDGDTLVVGAPQEDSNNLGGQPDNSAENSGAVYVYTREGTTWYPASYLKALPAGEGDLFGQKVAIAGDGSTIAVAAPNEDSGFAEAPEDDSIEDSGCVYVFQQDASFWYRQAYLKAPVIDGQDWFGRALALTTDGNVLAVGCPDEDSNGVNPLNDDLLDSGAVLVFERSDGAWLTPTYLKAPFPGVADRFGGSVSLSGDGSVLAVGTPGEDSDGTSPADDSLHASGAVFTFARSGGAWALQPIVKAGNPDMGDGFGGSVALSRNGDHLVVGAEEEDGGATGVGGDPTDDSVRDSGAVYVFQGSNGNFTLYASGTYLKALVAREEGTFGIAVAVSALGEVVAAGATGDDSGWGGVGADPGDDSESRSGAVYVLE